MRLEPDDTRAYIEDLDQMATEPEGQGDLDEREREPAPSREHAAR